jgi:acyl-CoA synthetase (AMP-forming)/AMP-acid ligase II
MDRVALLLPEGIDLVVSLFACFRLGAVAVPLRVGDAPERHDHILRDCEPRLILTAASGKENGERAALSELSDGAPLAESIPMPTDEDLAILLYTAGISGPPKGVMQIHGRLARAALRFAGCFGLSGSDRIATHLPSARASGLMGALLPGIAAGATVVMVGSDPSPQPPPRNGEGESQGRIRRFPPLRFGEGGKGGGVKNITLLLGAPADFATLAELPSSLFDPGALRLCLATGAPLPESVSEAFRRRYGVSIRAAWGTTEVPYACIVQEPDEAAPGAIGVPTPGVTIRLEEGELWLKSDVAPVGYWNNPAATATLLHDGWVHTGDRARMGGDGHLYLIDGQS